MEVRFDNTREKIQAIRESEIDYKKHYIENNSSGEYYLEIEINTEDTEDLNARDIKILKKLGFTKKFLREHHTYDRMDENAWTNTFRVYFDNEEELQNGISIIQEDLDDTYGENLINPHRSFAVSNGTYTSCEELVADEEWDEEEDW